MIAELEPRFRVLAPDTLSHGESSPPRTLFTISHHAASMFRLLDALDISQVAIAGNSMGAQISLEMAATKPDRVSHVVSVGCPAWGTETERSTTSPCGPQCSARTECDAWQASQTCRELSLTPIRQRGKPADVSTISASGT